MAEFDGGALTSDAGGLLLGADQRLGLVRRIARCSVTRETEAVEHSVATLIGQRVFGIALGYEDLNDHDELVNGAAIFLKSGAGKFPSLAGLAISRVSDRRLRSLAAGHDASGSAEWDWRLACGLKRTVSGKRSACSRRR